MECIVCIEPFLINFGQTYIMLIHDLKTAMARFIEHNQGKKEKPTTFWFSAMSKSGQRHCPHWSHP